MTLRPGVHVLPPADVPMRRAEKPRRTWNTTQLQAEFDVISFVAPYALVIRKSDSVKGTVQFEHHPRVYFDFKADL